MANGEVVEWVIPVPHEMNEQEFLHWESVNRPEECVLLERVEPIGAEEGKSVLWRAFYVEGDNQWAEMIL